MGIELSSGRTRLGIESARSELNEEKSVLEAW